MKKRIISFMTAILIIVSAMACCTAETAPELPTYTDEATGIRFVIPEGWEQQPLSQERQFLKMKMLPPGDSSKSIMFGYQDAWAQVPAATLTASGIKTRKDLDAIYMQPDMLAGASGADAKDIVFEEHGGYTFGVFTITNTQYGITLKMTVATTCINGYLIMFQLISDGDNEALKPALDAVLDSFVWDAEIPD